MTLSAKPPTHGNIVDIESLFWGCYHDTALIYKHMKNIHIYIYTHVYVRREPNKESQC